MSELQLKPLISYKGMVKSADKLHDICFFYFPFHGLSFEDFFQYFPILCYVESLIYQSDYDVESQKTSHSWTKTKEIILSLLKEMGWYDPKVEEILNKGDVYWDLELRMNRGERFTYEDLVKAMELRTTDFRILHAILHCLLNKPYDEELANLFFPMEVIADIEDDLRNYEKDVKNKSFNIYRMFIKYYGKEEAPKRLQRELEKYENLLMERISSLSPEEQERVHGLFDKFREVYPKPKIPTPIEETP
ncbi:MAG: hypothetical protein DRI61_14790 [Chloroflexi bacterium]|nr:MAG: hypothetical protein DRI61_14790 [Chloroflexota bacterium]